MKGDNFIKHNSTKCNSTKFKTQRKIVWGKNINSENGSLKKRIKNTKILNYKALKNIFLNDVFIMLKKYQNNKHKYKTNVELKFLFVVSNKIISSFSLKDIKQNNSLEFFVEQSFYELNRGQIYMQNWHITAICKLLEKVYKGQIKRLIITLPPRYMKSHCVTIAFSAWLLGMNPRKKIITASYNQQLSNNFLSQIKHILKSPWYKKIFPNTKITNGSGLKNKILTTENGFRFATSINGTLTGEGGDILIADDPHKPLDVINKNARLKVQTWFEGTFSSRLNDKNKGAIILIMQRLHEDDLIGYIQKKSNINEWNILNLELQSTEDKLITIDDFKYFRKRNEPLHILRQDIKQIQQLREDVGESVFNAQYQQNPISSDGRIIKKSWINNYSEDIDNIKDQDVNIIRHYFISIDAAVKSGLSNDYTAITIWYARQDNAKNLKSNKMSVQEIISNKSNEYKNIANRKMEINNTKKYNSKVDNKYTQAISFEDKIIKKHPVYLQDTINKKLTYPEIILLICDLINKYNPQGIIIEDAASGSQLIQHLKNVITVPIFGKVPTKGKQIRLTFASLFFEKKLININLKMTEYYTVINQLTNFPNTKHDDICDSISMFVNWFYDFYEPDINTNHNSYNANRSIRFL